MADNSAKVAESVPGKYYVDTSCTACKPTRKGWSRSRWTAAHPKRSARTASSAA